MSVDGLIDDGYCEKNYVKMIYPQEIGGLIWSAIQVSTASGVCAVADLVLTLHHASNGLMLQENFALRDILSNRFGKNFS